LQQCLALVRKRLRQHRELGDAFGAEVAIIAAQFAPGRDQGRFHKISHGNRTNDPAGSLFLLVGINNPQLAPFADRFAYARHVDRAGTDVRHQERRRVHGVAQAPR
jgi:hypothetical protein